MEGKHCDKLSSNIFLQIKFKRKKVANYKGLWMQKIYEEAIKLRKLVYDSIPAHIVTHTDASVQQKNEI